MASATEHDHNSMPWIGRSLRIYFLNISRGVGCLLHSLAHDLEFRYNESKIHSPGSNRHGRSCQPYIQPYFRHYAGFDYRTRHGAPFNSLYELGNNISYEDRDGDGVCETLVHANGTISNFDAAGGNCHYAPGAQQGYDYTPKNTVWSSIESFRKKNGRPQAIDSSLWSKLQEDPSIDGDCGGKFLTFWMQNMPGFNNDCFDDNGEPMLNWWPFMYY